MIFNSSQRNGVFILLFLIICIIILPGQFLRKSHNFFLLTDSDSWENDSLALLEDSTVSIPTINRPHKSGRSVPKVELNTADSSALDAIRGIGPYYAKRILHYRELLGGYHSIGQLKELRMKYFNVDSSALYFTVDKSLISKRDLDTMEFKSVLRHPYLEYEEVKAIFNAKRQYGRLSYSLLEEKMILPELTLKKIKPYFK